MLLSAFVHQGQQQGNDHHRGDQENILAEQGQTERGGYQADDGGSMVLGAEPLFHENGDEQGSQDKFDAFVVDGNQRACNGAQDGTCDPVDLVKQGHQKTITVAAEAFGGAVAGHQRVGLVGQSKNQVGFLLSGAFVGIHHGNSVKQVAGIDHQGGQGGSQQTGSTGQKTDGHVLHGACVNEQTHGCGPY